MSRPPLAERARPLLEYLLRLAVQDGGYEWLGLRGWARADEIRAAVRGKPYGSGALPRVIRHTPWLDREDVRDPGRKQPLWIFRISEDGVRALADAGAEVASFPTPLPTQAERPRTRFFLPLSSADALIALKAERLRPASGPYVPGEVGWLPNAVISERVSCFGLGRGVFSEDVARLVTLSLAEERRITPQRGAARALYRATEAGAAVEPLVWREPQDPHAPPEPPCLPAPATRGPGR